jgi:hypothetical protein
LPPPKVCGLGAPATGLGAGLGAAKKPSAGVLGIGAGGRRA